MVIACLMPTYPWGYSFVLDKQGTGEATSSGAGKPDAKVGGPPRTKGEVTAQARQPNISMNQRDYGQYEVD